MKGFAKNLKSKPARQNHKLSFGELVWLGFNATTGITFTAVFFSVVVVANKPQQGVGLHILWIFLLEAFIAGICAWAYARLSRVHALKTGASYVYARTSFGRFIGWMISFMQVMTFPLTITSQIVSMIRINFTDKNSSIHANWGTYGNVYLDLIGLAIFTIAALMILLGVKYFKRVFRYSSYVKWFSSILLIIGALALIFVNVHNGYGDGLSNTYNNTHLSIASFSAAFASCFYFFLGFETFSTIGSNLKNPEKHIGPSMILVMSLTALFMITTTTIFIAAIVANTYYPNPNIQVFDLLGDNTNTFWIKIAGSIIMIVCAISLKLNASSQYPFYASAIMQTQGKEGYISSKYSQITKENISKRAVWFTVITTWISFLIILLIPDFIYANSKTPTSEQINYSQIISITSIIFIIIYLVVVAAAIKLAFEKKMKAHWFELTLWIFVEIFLLWQAYQYFFGDATSSDSQSLLGLILNGNLVAGIVPLVCLAIVIFGGVIWYNLYYLPKYRVRLRENPGKQAVLNHPFRIVDDWKYVAKKIENEVDRYLKRNGAIYQNQENKNLVLASVLKDSISLTEEDLNKKYDTRPDQDVLAEQNIVKDQQQKNA